MQKPKIKWKTHRSNVKNLASLIKLGPHFLTYRQHTFIINFEFLNTKFINVYNFFQNNDKNINKIKKLLKINVIIELSIYMYINICIYMVSLASALFISENQNFPFDLSAFALSLVTVQITPFYFVCVVVYKYLINGEYFY